MVEASVQSPLAAAVGALARAVDQLEQHVGRHSSSSDFASELALMRSDRQKLAEALDEAAARARTLDAARITATEKIDRAIVAVRSVMAKDSARPAVTLDAGSDV